MKNDLLKEMIDKTCIETGCHVSNDNNIYTFIMLGGSDSIKMIFDLMSDINSNGLWYIEIFPINQNDKIECINFDSRENAIKAFLVWKNYYLMVVKENFKMF